MKFRQISPVEMHLLVLVSQVPSHPWSPKIVKGFRSIEARIIGRLFLGEEESSILKGIKGVGKDHWKEIMLAFGEFKKCANARKMENDISAKGFKVA